MFDVSKIRGDFPILKREVNGQHLVYFDNAATTQKPLSVIEAMGEFYLKHNANVHRGVHTLSDEATEAYDESRQTVAKFIGAKNDREIIFTKNSTEGINLLAYSLSNSGLIGKGDVVIVTEQDHHSNLVVWQMFCKRTGAELRVLRVDDEGAWIMDKSVFDRQVKLVAVSCISNVLGVVNPLEKLLGIVREKSPVAKVLLDGSQAVGHIKIDVSSLGVDFLVFSAHKMLGPMGVGVLWGREKYLNEMPPFLFGGDMIDEVSLSGASWAGLPSKFEAGTPNVAGAVGLARAISYLEGLGMANVERHSWELADYVLEKIVSLEKQGLVSVYGPKRIGERVGIVSFNIAEVHAHDAASVLDSFGVAVRSGQMCAAPLVDRLGKQAVLRVSFYVYNTKNEIDYFVSRLGQVKKVFFS